MRLIAECAIIFRASRHQINAKLFFDLARQCFNIGFIAFTLFARSVKNLSPIAFCHQNLFVFDMQQRDFINNLFLHNFSK